MSKQPPPAPTASAVGPCPTVIQIVGRPGTESLPSTFAPPDHPQNVRKISETNRKSCLCKACCNVALKVEALKSFVTKHKMSVQIDKKKVVSATLCPTEEGKENRSKCLKRECKDCGVKGLQDYLKVQLEQSMKDDLEITWNKWELITVQKEDKSSKRITSCVAKAASFHSRAGKGSCNILWSSIPCHLATATNDQMLRVAKAR